MTLLAPALAGLAGLALAVVVWLLREPLFRGWRRARIRARPFPHAWREALRRRVPLVRRLPADLQLQLKKSIQVFLAETPFVGCAGLEVSEEMRVTIAAQACLLLLNRRGADFAHVTQVLVYPGRFRVERERIDALGLASRERQTLAGESWAHGQVVLSWEDVVDGAADPADGRNVVIHEFAHQLDQVTGSTNGAPALPGRARRARWAEVLGAEYAALQSQLADGQPTLIDAYGATNPAEFFAVVAELFFERPAELAAGHPALFAELRGYFRVDPLAW